MKKLLFAAALILSASCICHEAHAQMNDAYIKSLTLSKTSLSSADTSIAKVVIDKTVIGVEAIGTKTSGTMAGKAYLVGFDLKGTNSKRVDSLTFSDTTGDQWKIFAIPLPTVYSKYEIQFYSTNGVWVPAVYNLRRP